MPEPPQELKNSVAFPSDLHGRVDHQLFIQVEACFSRIELHRFAFDRERSRPGQVLLFEKSELGSRLGRGEAPYGNTVDLDPAHHLTVGGPTGERESRPHQGEDEAHGNSGREHRVNAEGEVAVHLRGRPRRPGAGRCRW